MRARALTKAPTSPTRAVLGGAEALPCASCCGGGRGSQQAGRGVQGRRQRMADAWGCRAPNLRSVQGRSTCMAASAGSGRAPAPGTAARAGGRARRAGLGHIGALTRLRSLCLWNCMRVSEAGLAVLQRLPALAELSLRGCQHLTDAAAPAVARLAALTRLDLRCCERFTGARPGPLRAVLRPEAPQTLQRSARSAPAARGVMRLRPGVRACCRAQQQAQCQEAAHTERRRACMTQSKEAAECTPAGF